MTKILAIYNTICFVNLAWNRATYVVLSINIIMSPIA